MDHIMSAFLNTPIQGNKQSYSKETSSKSSNLEKNFESILSKNKKDVHKIDRDTIKETSKVDLQNSSSIVESRTTFEADSKINKEEALEMVMQLLMSVLNLSLEQIEEVLNTQNIGVEDLVCEEAFRVFVMEALETDELTLLNDNEQMRVVKQLWEDLQVINNNEHILKQTLFIEDGVVTAETTQELSNNSLEQEQQLAPIEIMGTNKVIEDLKKVDGQIGNNENLMMPKSYAELGMSIPIQAVTQIQGVQFWQELKGSNILHSNNELNNPLHTQLLEKIHYAELQSGKELNIELSPKELGKLALKMVEQNGSMTAQIKVEQERTKELIMQNIEVLKEGLEKQGLTISNVQVEVKQDPHHTHMEKEKQKSTKRIQELISRHMEEELEGSEQDVKIDNLTSVEVDYKA